MRELGLYVHFPFCRHRCGYCDFNAYTLEAQARLDEVRDGLHREIELRRPFGEGRRVLSIFFGGGTPTLYAADDLVGVLDHLRAAFAVVEGAEVTVEANPGTVDQDKLDRLAAAGVNRLSFGAQSFDEGELRLLERIHGPEDIRAAVAMARRAGVPQVNLDLMFGLPEQTWERLRRSVEEALRLEPEHLSLYALELEPSTRFGRLFREGRLTLPPEEEVVAMGDRAAALIEAAGLRRYEVSNFARPGCECRHNLHTWRRGEYVGVGPGAHSFVDERRFWNLRSPAAWRRRLLLGEMPTEDEEDVSRLRVGEWIYLRLRLTEGVRFDEFTAFSGEDARTRFRAEILALADLGLLEVDEAGFRATARGRWLLNRVAAAFLSP